MIAPNFNALSSEAEAASIYSRMSSVLQPIPKGFRLTKKAGWAAVPLERSMHLSPPLQVRIADEFTAMKLDFFYAVAFELRDSLVPVYRVRSSAVAVAEFNKECGQFDYVLCPPDISAIVLCSASGDYIAVAGGLAFIEAVAGTDLQRAYENFTEHAAHPGWTPSEHRFFESLMSTLRDDYQFTVTGGSVTFPPPQFGQC